MGEQHIQVDAAIIGAGAGGLTLLAHLGRAGWRGTLAMIDDDQQAAAVRRWAWWSRGDGVLDPYAGAALTQAKVAGDGWERTLDLSPYTYRVISADGLRRAATAPGASVHAVTWVSGVATSLEARGGRTEVTVRRSEGGTAVVSAGRAFDSVGVGLPAHARLAHLDLLGWEVRARGDVFDPGAATLMDFRTDQSDGVSFVYVLPTSSRAALVERVTFRTDRAAVDHAPHLERYLEEVLGLDDPAVDPGESGTIPLTVPAGAGASLGTLLGVPAGAVKSSSGYAFMRMQEHAARLASAMVDGAGEVPGLGSRAWPAALDRALLMACAEEPSGARAVLESMLRRIDGPDLLRFLDEELPLRAQVRLFSRVPFWVFPRARLRSLTGRRRGT